MRAIIQRATRAGVTINGGSERKTGPGLVVLLGIEDADTSEDVTWLVNKISKLRIFNDTDGKMNFSIKDVGGEFLVVSQFTLHASIKKGTRPSYVRAAKPTTAIPFYEEFVSNLKRIFPGKVQTGEFGADMQVSLVNDGPVTILIDTKNKE